MNDVPVRSSVSQDEMDLAKMGLLVSSARPDVCTLVFFFSKPGMFFMEGEN